MQASPGPPESLAGLATAPGSARRLRLHVAEHHLQAEQAGIAQGAQFVGCRQGFPCRAARSAQRRACSSSLARPAGAGASGGSAALDGMQGRGAAWTPSPEAGVRAGRRCTMSGTKRRNTWTISSRLLKRPTISPRASTSSPASAAVAGAPRRAPAEMTEQAKHQALLVDRLRHMVVHARRQAASRSASEALRSWPRSAARRSARRRGFSRVASKTIDIQHLHVHQHRVEQHARLQHLLNARQPAVGEAARAALAAQQLGGDHGGSARCPPLPADARPATAGCAPPGAAAGWPGRPVRRATHAAPSRPVAWA